MVAGLFIVGLVPLGYLLSSAPWHVYFFQVVHAVGMAMALPSWLAIFTRHIDKGKEAFEWSMETTSIGAGAGIAGGLGGIMASMFGFQVLFIFVSALTIFAALILLLVKNNVSNRGEDMLCRTKSPLLNRSNIYHAEPGTGKNF